MRNKPKPCRCPAYAFPHRLDSGKCRELYNEPEPDNRLDYMTLNEISRADKGSASHADFKRDEYR